MEIGVKSKFLKKLIFPIVFSLLFSIVNSYYNTENKILHFFVYFIICFIISSGAYIFKNKLFGQTKEIINNSNDLKRFIIYFVILLLGWSIMLLSFWPGIFPYDTYHSTIEYEAGSQVVFPITSQIFFKSFFNINMNNRNIGVLLTTITQMILCSASISYMILFLHRTKIKKWFEIFTILFFTFFPIISILTIICAKDMLFTAFFILFITTLAYNCFDESFLRRKPSLLLLFISTIGIILLRPNGSIYMIAVIVILFLMNNKYKPLHVILGAFLIAICMQTLLQNITKINDQFDAEKYSMPIQQIARVYNYEQESLSLEEQERIKTILPEIEQYNQFLSDPVKSSARISIKDIMLLWPQILINHFNTCIDAFLYSVQGYFYMNDTSVVNMYKTDDNGTWNYLVERNNTEAKVLERTFIPQLKEFILDIFKDTNYENNTFLKLFCNMYLFVWILLFELCISIKSKDKSIIQVSLCIFLYFATLLFGPCALLRYLIPIISTLPVLIAINTKKLD